MKKTTPAKSLKLVVLLCILRSEMRKKWYVARRPKDLQAGVHLASKRLRIPKMGSFLSLDFNSRAPNFPKTSLKSLLLTLGHLIL